MGSRLMMKAPVSLFPLLLLLLGVIAVGVNSAESSDKETSQVGRFKAVIFNFCKNPSESCQKITQTVGLLKNTVANFLKDSSESAKKKTKKFAFIKFNPVKFSKNLIVVYLLSTGSLINAINVDRCKNNGLPSGVNVVNTYLHPAQYSNNPFDVPTDPTLVTFITSVRICEWKFDQ